VTNTSFAHRLRRLAALAIVCLLGTYGAPRLFAQATPTSATLTEWDLFAATGGDDAASQNVAAVVLDASGIAGPAGNVWVTLQNPLPRLGRLDPSAATNNYLEWRPVTATEGGGAPLGLALNRSNGDIWMTMQGHPSLLLKLAGTNTFRKFRSTYPLVAQGVVVAADGSAIVALPSRNVGGIGDAIIRVPKTPTSGSVTATVWNVRGEPHYVALDNSGNIWFSEGLNNILGRLNPSTGAVTEWALPAGTNPAGVHVAGTTVCVASQGGVGDLTGVEQCLNTSNNQITLYSRAPGDGFDLAQQTSVNSDTETFVTEQNGNSVSFIAFAARAAATVSTVTPTTRTVTPTTTKLTVPTDFTSVPTTRTVTPSQSTSPGVDNGGGYVRFSIPPVAMTFPFEQTGYPQPVGLTPVLNDQGRGTGTVFFGEYFDGPLLGRTPGARIGRLALSTAPPVVKTIVTNPTSLQFDAVSGSAAPGGQAVAITETAGQSLSWTATKTAAWLTLTPASGAAPSSLTATVDHASLAAGTYTDTITIDDGPGNAAAKTVSVTLNVAAAPTIGRSPASMSFAATARGDRTPAQLLTVTNTGSGSLEWTATSSQPWVIINPASGTAPSTVEVFVDPKSLNAAGTQNATITIASTGASNTPLTVAITAVISNTPPSVGISPTTMSFSAARGAAAPAAQALTITNTGGGTLAWAAGPSDGWLTATPDSGSLTGGSSTSASITVNQAALTRGVHTGTVLVQDPNVQDDQTLTVTLTVTSPTISLGNSIIGLTAVRTAASPANETVTVGNAGDATLNYTSTVTSGNSWISVLSGGSGAVAPSGSANLVLAFNTTGLAKGNYSGTIEVADPNADNSPQVISVQLTVQAPVIATSPSTLTFAATQGLNPNTQSLNVTNNGDAPLTFTPSVTTTTGGAWLSVSPSGQTVVAPGATATLTATVTSAALGAASYSGSIAIVDSTATNSPVTIPVSLTVSPGPVLSLSSTAIAVAALKSGANPSNVTASITNPGGASLTYSSSVTSGAWLSIVSGGSGTIAANGPAATLTLAIDITGLAKGTYIGTVQVTAPGASGSPGTITVTLTVQAPTIGVSPTSLAYSVLRSRNPASQTITLTNTGDATMTFTTGAPTTSGGSWLAVSPAGGTLAAGASTTLTATVTSAAIASGSYSGSVTITDPAASNSPLAVPVALTVTPAPTISAGAASLTFSVTESLDPANQTVVITNTGDGSLTFTPNVTTGSGGAWLSVSPSGATTIAAGGNATLTVSVASTSLAAGPYTGNIEIADANATNTPQNVAVSLTVNAAPVISRSPATLTYSVLRGRNPATQAITLTNAGSATMNWSAAATMNNGAGWLAVSPASGTLAPGANTTLTVTVTSSALTTNTYTGNIRISDPAAPNTPVDTPVSLTVAGAPTIALSSASLNFTAKHQALANPANQTVTLTNTGDATLTYTASASSTGNWLSVSASSSSVSSGGVDSDTLTISVNNAGLTPGTYNGTVTITDGNATNSPATIAVQHVVTVAPFITRTPASLTYTARRTTNPAVQTITLSNTGSASMSWSAAATMATGSGWLAVSPASGTLAPTDPAVTLTVTVTSSALTTGGYTGNIRITDAAAPNTPVDTPVGLTVTAAPTIVLSSASLNFTAKHNGASPANQTVTLTNSGDATLNYTAAASSTGNWLSVSASSSSVNAGGVDSDTLTLSVNNSGLAVGTYNGTVTVTDPSATVSPVTINVQHVVTAAPRITAPASLSFTATRFTLCNGTTVGTNPANQNIAVGNTGSATLNFTAADNATWLSLAPASGTVAVSGSTNVVASINMTGLAAGTYNGTVTITDAAASNSPVTVPVTLTATTAAAKFCATTGGSPVTTLALGSIARNSNKAGTITVYNAGDGTVTYTFTQPTAVTRSTITMSPTVGTVVTAPVSAPVTPPSASSTITVTVAVAGNSTTGNKTTTFTITPSAGGPAVTITVTYTVT
jgi:hypothetical protein